MLYFSGTVPTNLANNDLFGCGTLYRDANTPGNNQSTIAGVNGLGFASGNVSVDPGFVDSGGADGFPSTLDDNDWHPQSAGIQSAGLDLSGTFTNDRDGTTRTGDGSTGWSIGAYEF